MPQLRALVINFIDPRVLRFIYYLESYESLNVNKEFRTVADKRVKVYCIFHIVLFRCEECFINWSTMLYGATKLNKIQLCMKSISLPC